MLQAGISKRAWNLKKHFRNNYEKITDIGKILISRAWIVKGVIIQVIISTYLKYLF